jgi:hypothetical protein
MARDRIVTTDPEDLALLLSVSAQTIGSLTVFSCNVFYESYQLWYLRLACLARLRLFNQTSAECTNFFSVLNAIEPPSSKAWLFDRLLPFELEVMQARLKYWAGDHMAYLDALSALLGKCRKKARMAKGDAATASMWQERGARICLIIASQLVEMKVFLFSFSTLRLCLIVFHDVKDFTAATNLLEPLCIQANNTSSPALRSCVARIYLQAGNTHLASKHFTAVASDPGAEQSMKDMNAALLASAMGNWMHASEKLRQLLAEDADNFIVSALLAERISSHLKFDTHKAVNNLSVALLSQGKLKEVIFSFPTPLFTRQCSCD